MRVGDLPLEGVQQCTSDVYSLPACVCIGQEVQGGQGGQEAEGSQEKDGEPEGRGVGGGNSHSGQR